MAEDAPPTDVVAEGVWCSECLFFFLDSDPGDAAECGHLDDVRFYAVVARA